MQKIFILFSLSLTLFIFVGCGGQVNEVDQQLQAIVQTHQLEAMTKVSYDEAKVALGQALFFDKELSGNRDIACATCHHPSLGSGDELPVSIGTGGQGLGLQRQIGYGRSFIPRNAPEVFNRGHDEWETMFWDSRVFLKEDGTFGSPAGEQLPDGLDNVLAVQAMFPVTSGDEMRGAANDSDVHGEANELSTIDEADLVAIWDGIMTRLLNYPEYVALFQAAYPDIPVEALGFQHAANAIAAFEIDAYTLTNAPWDRYLRGETEAMSEAAKRGALLFYGEARCASCHSGNLFTDQAHHALAVPQVGPGKGAEAPEDMGRMRETGEEADEYAFRTPPLRNVAMSGPWMHDGAYSTLEAAVRHHLNPAASLLAYEPEVHLPLPLQATFQDDPATILSMLENVDEALTPTVYLTDSQVQDLLAFLQALTDPAVFELDAVEPASVPSGLPVADEAGEEVANRYE